MIEACDQPTPIHVVDPDGLGALFETLSESEAAWARASRFDAGAGMVALLPTALGTLGKVLFGVGGNGAARNPLMAGSLPGLLPQGDYDFVGALPDPLHAAIGWALGNYRFSRYRAASGPVPRLLLPKGVAPHRARTIARAVALVRDLVNTPANDLGPAELAEAIRAAALRHGAAVEEVVGDRLLAAGFPMVHAVGRAASPARAPRLVDLTWGEADHPKVTLVGKGVVFDTGGLDIKPSSGMLLMKKDMGGAANALGLAEMIMAMNLPVRLRLIVPAVENAISGDAFRPGDILRSRAGLSVEIGNTDAEGRLVLADALALAAEETPDLLIDLATLTGAARVALGPEVPPFFTRDDALAAALSGHAERVGDPLWRLPLWRPYAAMLDSKMADINNAGSGGMAGSITAALFLARFVPEAIPWIHADIYAWNPSSRPARPEGGEAQAIRALFSLIEARYGRPA
nr:leucyl aminopeptidase family protein [Prosthecomicrobium pneumaticum]